MGLLGNDAKMTLLSYSDDKFKAGEKKVELNFKPESLNLKLGNKVANSCVINSISGTGAFIRGNPAKLELTFIIDTSIFDDMISFGLGTPKEDLNTQLDNLVKNLYSMDGKTHESRYLVLKWGKMRLGNSVGGGFYCRLQNMDIKYTLIGPDGVPKVAELTCSFIENLSSDKQEQRAGKNSPDLTHTRMVLSADTLAQKTDDIYRDPAYLVGVAEFNGLDSLRGLESGQTLTFPPLEK